MASSFVSSSQTETLPIGSATDTGICYDIVQVAVGPGWTGSLAPQKRVRGSNAPFAGAWYTNESNANAQTNNITGSGVFSFDITGTDLQMVHTMTSSGSVTVTSNVLRQ